MFEQEFEMDLKVKNSLKILPLRHNKEKRNLNSIAIQHHATFKATSLVETYSKNLTTSSIRTDYVRHNEGRPTEIQLNYRTKRYKKQNTEPTHKSRLHSSKFISF